MRQVVGSWRVFSLLDFDVLRIAWAMKEEMNLPVILVQSSFQYPNDLFTIKYGLPKVVTYIPSTANARSNWQYPRQL